MRFFQVLISAATERISILVLSLLCVCPPFAEGHIRIDTLAAVEEAAAGDSTLVILDIHGTLAEAREYLGLGSDAWVATVRPRVSFDVLCRTWGEIHSRVPLSLLDPESPASVRRLQSRHFTVALTGGLPELVGRYREQLDPLGYSFDRSVGPMELKVPAKKGGSQIIVPFQHGIIAAGPFVSKGAVILALVEKLQLKPKKIVAVDDQVKFLDEIGADLTPRFEFVGLHYQVASANANFAPDMVLPALDRLAADYPGSQKRCSDFVREWLRQ